MFSGEVKIMVTERGYVFYDITKIKRLPVNSGLTENDSAAASGNLSTDSISKNESSVNDNYMQENKRYSITPETQLDLFEKFKSGEITEDEYRRIISKTTQ